MAGWSGAQRSPKTIAGEWHYSGNPADSSRDMVRFLIGDTDDQDKLLSDEEIAAAIASEANVRAAAAFCAEGLAAYFSREADKTVGDTTEHNSSRASAFAKLAKTLRMRSRNLAAPFAGGISVADKASRAADTDRNGSPLSVDQFDNTVAIAG